MPISPKPTMSYSLAAPSASARPTDRAASACSLVMAGRSRKFSVPEAILLFRTPDWTEPTCSHVDDQRPDLQAAAEHVDGGASIDEIPHHLARHGLRIATHARLDNSVIPAKNIQTFSRGGRHFFPSDQSKS